MGKNSNFGMMILAAASFTAGYAVGLLMAPRSGKESREMLRKRSAEALSWAEEKGHEMVEESEKKFNEINEKVHQTVKDNIPDLSEAMDDVHMSDEDVIS